MLAIGGMSLVLAMVLELLGFSKKLDALVSHWITSSGLEGEFRGLPGYAIWVWTVPLAFGLAVPSLTPSPHRPLSSRQAPGGGCGNGYGAP